MWVYCSINKTGQRNDKNGATIPWECLGLSLLAGVLAGCTLSRGTEGSVRDVDVVLPRHKII